MDAVATLSSGLAGTSPGTAYVESIAGIRMGARTGRASVVTALCFVPCFFLAPLAAAVPGYATATVLILVGVSMFQAMATIDFSSLEDARQMALRLKSKPATVVLLAVSGDMPNLIFGRSADLTPDMGKLLKEISAAYGGRGGGQAELAQGGVAGCHDTVSTLSILMVAEVW